MAQVTRFLNPTLEICIESLTPAFTLTPLQSLHKAFGE